MPTPITIQPIATIHSPFKEKFGIPRQSGLAPSATGEIRFEGDYNNADAVRGLEKFSHLWVLFLFDQHLDRDWTPLIRPPRLGGNEKIGVFASRSTFRPNMIGQSVVKLESVNTTGAKVSLTVSGFDLLDQTPVVDIKPYIPYSDAIPDADGSFAASPPDQLLKIEFSEKATAQCAQLEDDKRPKLKSLITEVIGLDPRPAYKQGKHEDRLYGVRLFDLDIRFSVTQSSALIEDILVSPRSSANT